MKLPMVLLLAVTLPAAVWPQGAVPAPPASQVIIDAVVTGKGGVVKDLSQKDFKLSIDGKDQVIESVTVQSAAGWPQRPNKRCFVLVFDGQTITTSDQSVLRQRVSQFIDSAARPDRYVAIVSWFTEMRVIQPFTSDAALLKKALDSAMQGVAMTATPTAPTTLRPGGRGSSSSNVSPDEALAVQRMMQSLQPVADALGAIRGRKALMLFTGGRQYQTENDAYIQGAVEALNRANVAVYGISDDLAFANTLAVPTGGTNIRMAYATPDALLKAAVEMDSNYLLTFTPAAGLDGGCHRVQVKITASGDEGRSRRQVCYEGARDALAGKPIGKDLEAKALGAAAGGIPVAMRLPYFFTASNRARVSITAELGPTGMKIQREKGKFVGELDVVGVAVNADGSPGPRFSEARKFAFETQEQAESFSRAPYHYENQVEFPSGRYTVNVAFGASTAFGRAQATLSVDPWTPTAFAVGGIAIGKARRAASSGLTAALPPTLLEGLVPLLLGQVQVVPTGLANFSANENYAVYTEVHAPGGDPGKAAGVSMQVRVTDRVSGALKFDTGPVSGAEYAQPGSAVIPLVFDLPAKQLGAGAYRMEISAQAGTATVSRTMDYELK